MIFCYQIYVGQHPRKKDKQVFLKHVEQISYISTCVESRKLHKWSYLQGRNRGTDIESKYMYTKERWVELGGRDLHISTTDLCIK